MESPATSGATDLPLPDTERPGNHRLARRLGAAVAAGALLAAGFGLGLAFDSNPASGVRSHPLSIAWDFSDPRKMAGWADNVFIARVTSGPRTSHSEIGIELQFDVVVEEQFKGRLSQETVVNVFDSLATARAGNLGVVVGERYLFGSRLHPNGQWQTVDRPETARHLRTAEEVGAMRPLMQDAVRNQIEYTDGPARSKS